MIYVVSLPCSRLKLSHVPSALIIPITKITQITVQTFLLVTRLNWRLLAPKLMSRPTSRS